MRKFEYLLNAMLKVKETFLLQRSKTLRRDVLKTPLEQFFFSFFFKQTDKKRQLFFDHT